MRRAGTRLAVTALLLTLGALLSIAVAAGSRSANSTTFDDPGGDSGNGADVTRVRVTTQDDGQLVFQITLPNRESLVGTESVQVYIDSDRNGSTGTRGADFVIGLYARTGQVFIDKWTGSGYARQRQSLESGFTARAVTLRVRQTELALTGWFDFQIIAYASPYSPTSATVGDRAPNSGNWRHSLVPGAGPPVTTTPRVPPPPPADSDKDGISDFIDDCVKQKGGRDDFNRNGCPGPFLRMTLRLTAPYRTSEDHTWWASERLPILGGAPPRARVLVDDGIHTEKGVTNQAGRYKSTLLLTTKYALGRVITFKVTKRGWIGAHWEIKILNRSPGFETRRILCIPPSGGSSRDCRQVSRGS